MTVTAKELTALQVAINVLDALWDFDAVRGNRDARGGAEYERLSPAPTLSALYDRLRKEANQR